MSLKITNKDKNNIKIFISLISYVFYFEKIFKIKGRDILNKYQNKLLTFRTGMSFRPALYPK